MKSNGEDSHQPSTFEDSDGVDTDGSDSERVDTDGSHTSRVELGANASGESWVKDPADPATAERTFDRRGWILVSVIVIAFVVAPVTILLLPPGENYLFALVIVPLAPAILLALTAVWATTRP